MSVLSSAVDELKTSMSAVNFRNLKLAAIVKGLGKGVAAAKGLSVHCD